MEDKKKLVLEVMINAQKPVRPGEVTEKTGLDSKEVSKIISELKKSGEVISPKRCFYAPAN